MGKQSDRYQTFFFTVLDLAKFHHFLEYIECVYAHTFRHTHTHILTYYIFYPYEIDFDALIEEGI